MRELCSPRNTDLAAMIQIQRDLLQGKATPPVLRGVRRRHKDILDAPAGPDDHLFLEAAAPLLRDIGRLEARAGKGE
jgi:hypothetical protein